MKLRNLITTVAAFALAGSLQAQLVIGDFETGLDGWSDNGSGSGLSLSTVWSSTGTSSLRVDGTGGFVWGLYYDNLANLSQMDTLPVIAADVYWRTSDWVPTNPVEGTWARWDNVAVNSGETGWAQSNDGLIGDSANPSFPGSWDPYSWGTEHQRTITWDLTTLVGGTGIGTGGWAQLNISVNDNAVSPDIYYIDNIRLLPVVPEPSTFALLGLGGALLAIRRRCK